MERIRYWVAIALINLASDLSRLADAIHSSAWEDTEYAG